MINSRLEDPFLPPRTKPDLLAMKREHDNIRQHRQIQCVVTYRVYLKIEMH